MAKNGTFTLLYLYRLTSLKNHIFYVTAFWHGGRINRSQHCYHIHNIVIARTLHYHCSWTILIHHLKNMPPPPPPKKWKFTSFPRQMQKQPFENEGKIGFYKCIWVFFHKKPSLWYLCIIGYNYYSQIMSFAIDT